MNNDLEINGVTYLNFEKSTTGAIQVEGSDTTMLNKGEKPATKISPFKKT
jgi:hypothetical protein